MISQLVIADWTGRDKAALWKHICEVEEIGVRAESHADLYGEVEFVLIQDKEPVSRDSWRYDEGRRPPGEALRYGARRVAFSGAS